MERQSIEPLSKEFGRNLQTLSRENYDVILAQFQQLELNGEERSEAVIRVAFDSILEKPMERDLFARMCKVIADENVDFRRCLISRSLDEFRNDERYPALNVEDKYKEIDREPEPSARLTLEDHLYEAMRRIKLRYLGVIKLLGEMYKFDYLTGRQITLCMEDLINRDKYQDEHVEALCNLILTTCRKLTTMESDPCDTQRFNQMLDKLDRLYKSRIIRVSTRVGKKIWRILTLRKYNWSHVEGERSYLHNYLGYD